MKVKLCLLFLFTCFLVKAQIYVDKDATGSNDGTSWGNAYTSLQDALANDSTGDEIWIAEGNYIPGTNRTDSFILNQTSLKLYGGFNGTESLLSERNITLHKTILDGDVNGDDTGINYFGVNRSDNILNIVKVQSTNCTIDGVTIANGHADDTSSSDRQEGSAVLIDADNMTIKNCIIEKNLVRRLGVVQMIDYKGFLNIENTVFNENFGNGGVALYTRASGGILNVNLTNCLVSNNTLEAVSGAGKTGILWFRQDINNSNFGQTVTLTNCTVVNNNNNTNTTDATLLNSSRITSNPPVNVRVYNSIFWGNRNGVGDVMHSIGNDTNQLSGKSYIVETSVGEDGGFDNIATLNAISNTSASKIAITNVDPLFNSTTDFGLQSSSPVVNNGDNSKIPSGVTTDILGNDRIQSLGVDFGCYESPHTTANTPLNIIFVDTDAGGNNDGSTWVDAYSNLQDALDNYATGKEIWVAKGTYHPSGSNGRNNTFEISVNRTKLYGGFAGTESNFNQRDLSVNQTILSGDINDDDTGVSFTGNNRSENAYNVLTVNTLETTIDGFTISGGQADGATSNTRRGSGLAYRSTIASFDSNASVSNVIFEDNVSISSGTIQGGLRGDLALHNTIIRNNLAQSATAIFVFGFNPGLDVIMSNCLIEGNTVSDSVLGTGSNGILWFRNDGGGTPNGTTNVTLINSTLVNNKNTSNSSNLATLFNVNRNTFFNNGPINLNVYNSIFWNNLNANNQELRSVGNEHATFPNGNIQVKNSLSFDGFFNVTNTNTLSSNPLFTDDANNDFTLQSGSPAIDAGSSSDVPSEITEDLAGNARISGGSVDMGAYESLITQYTLTLNATDGTITPDPAGGTYDDGTSVTLTATPDAGYEFVEWSGDASGTTNPLIITMDADKTITATFAPIQRTLTVNATNGAVTTNPNPTNGTYDDGTSVTLTATPDAGYEFVEWSGDASGTTNPLIITMDADKTITATFAPIQRTLTVNATNGAVTINPNPTNGTYSDGASVTLTATPDAGYEFVEWSGDVSGTTNPLIITMDADKTITATFAPIQRTLTITAIDGNVTTSPNPVNGTYDQGTVVTLTAVPDSGFSFDAWSGDATGTTTQVTITMDSDKNVTATFSATLGVNEDKFKVPFKLYPNPVTDVLRIESQEVVHKVKIYNTLGKEVLFKNSFDEETINVSNLSQGIYFMIIETETGKGVRRFIKK
ncbi:InlB B-repeat-containing protein [Tenacibaculum sp. SZ-18]|uniref:InlB B-repeat-containing protein n=1 Tax=Tenacibaculum sp. SZ-18 TaxID=754423 RepID=UPI0018E28AF3|nr:choice-of-anchor Q domain-containing protein [Tenacibaculum sp. SZ-18]